MDHIHVVGCLLLVLIEIDTHTLLECRIMLHALKLHTCGQPHTTHPIKVLPPSLSAQPSCFLQSEQQQRENILLYMAFGRTLAGHGVRLGRRRKKRIVLGRRRDLGWNDGVSQGWQLSD